MKWKTKENPCYRWKHQYRTPYVKELYKRIKKLPLDCEIHQEPIKTELEYIYSLDPSRKRNNVLLFFPSVDLFNNRGVTAVKTNGKHDIFSPRGILKLVFGKTKSPMKKKVLIALRSEISEIPPKGYEIHHQVPFSVLSKAWMEKEKLDYKNIETFDDGTLHRMKNEIQRRSWIEFHETHKKMKLMTKKEHKKIDHRKLIRKKMRDIKKWTY